MRNPYKAIKEWWKILKCNGYLYIIVPDEDLYEQGVFPSRWNMDHKHTFTIYKKSSWSPVSINILDLIKTLPNARLVKVELQDDNYDYNLHNVDQTYEGNNMHAMAQIVFVLQKNSNEMALFSFYRKKYTYKVKSKIFSIQNCMMLKKQKLLLFLKYLYSKFNLLKEKFFSEKYSGIGGKIFFFIKLLKYISTRIFYRKKSYAAYIKIEKKITDLRNHIFWAITKKGNIDLLLIQPNGLGDAIINKAYTDLIISHMTINNNSIIILASDAWKDFHPILHKNISIKFFNLEKFERNILYRLHIYKFLSKYKFKIAICNLRWKSPSIIKNLISFVNADFKSICLNHERHTNLNTELDTWSKNFNISCFDTNSDQNEISRILSYYKNIFDLPQKLNPIRTVLRRPDGKNPVFVKDEKYIVFHIGNSDKRRRWSIEKFLQTANFFKVTGYEIVFCGGERESDLKTKIDNKFFCYINQLTAVEYTILISDAAAMLSGDTGPAHLSVALGTPTAVILGGGHYGHYFPYPENVYPSIKYISYIKKRKKCFNCDWDCIFNNEKKFSCIHDICVNDVIDGINTILIHNKAS